MPIFSDHHVVKRLLPIVTALVLSLMGVALFLTFNLPLPWLLGAIFPLLIASQFKRINVAAAKPLVNPSRLVLGVAIGSAFTPEIIQSLDQYLLSLVFMVPFLISIILIGKLYYQHIVQYDRTTSSFCALPGGLLEMMLICEALGADQKKVLLTHATRVILIIYAVPFLIQLLTPYDLSKDLVLGAPIAGLDMPNLLLVFLIAILGWWLALKIGLTGAAIVGPMTICAALYVTGIFTVRPPGELINLAQLILGMRIGLSFQGINIKEILQNIFYAVGLFILLISATLLTAKIIGLFIDIPFIATLLAYVPGGQAEINVVAIMVGIHVPYIALHHVTRMFLVIAFTPTIVRFIR